MHDRLVKTLSTAHVAVFRSSGGRWGSRLVENDMAVLTTTGRISGRPHAVPLLILDDGPDWVVIASYGGRIDHPEWYRNLCLTPLAELQLRGHKILVIATTMDDEERASWWPRIVEAYAGYEEYASRTDRQIPVVRLARHS